MWHWTIWQDWLRSRGIYTAGAWLVDESQVWCSLAAWEWGRATPWQTQTEQGKNTPTHKGGKTAERLGNKGDTMTPAGSEKKQVRTSITSLSNLKQHILCSFCDCSNMFAEYCTSTWWGTMWVYISMACFVFLTNFACIFSSTFFKKQNLVVLRDYCFLRIVWNSSNIYKYHNYFIGSYRLKALILHHQYALRHLFHFLSSKTLCWSRKTQTDIAFS